MSCTCRYNTLVHENNADTFCTTRRYNEIIHGAHVYLMMGVTEHGFSQVCYVKLFSVFQLQSTQDMTFKAKI